jgi:hypothetical protein
VRTIIRTGFAAYLLLSTALWAQETAPPQQPAPEKTPQIKLNFLNVCTPNEAEKKELASALNKVSQKINYSGDFEVTRGRTVSNKEGAAKYVRLRREVIGDANFSNVLFLLSVDDKNTTETLVLKVKDPKDLVSISIEDQISAGAAKPTTVLDTDTPASHIKMERFGKTAIALARCENADQSSYEPLFAQATQLIAQYRKTLGLRTMFRTDLAWLSTPNTPPTDKAKTPSTKSTKPAGAKSSAETKPAAKHLN